MSTRANIIVKDNHGGELIFYRHSDGYPEGALPTLNKFLDWVKEDRIRDNAEQSAGWLIILGRQEYAGRDSDYSRGYKLPEPSKPARSHFSGYGGADWKVGAIEPATGIHGDIEFLYVIDLGEKTINIDGENGFTYRGQFKAAA